MKAAEKGAGGEFGDKDACGVQRTPQDDRTILQVVGDRTDDKGQPIDGEHPDR